MIDHAEGLRNYSVPIDTPYLRHTFADSYPLVVFAYLLIIVFGVVANSMEIYTILRRQLYDNATYVYLMNLAVADLVKCLFVLPVSITTLLLQNWIFGSFMCYFVPMLQVSNILVLVRNMSFLSRWRAAIVTYLAHYPWLPTRDRYRQILRGTTTDDPGC